MEDFIHMRNTIIAVAVLCATLLGVAFQVDHAGAASSCSATAYQPVDVGNYVNGSGRGACTLPVYVYQQQVCLYRNNVAVVCRTWYPQQSVFTGTVSVLQSGGGYATYQTYVWIYDSQGYSKGAWSATAYLGV